MGDDPLEDLRNYTPVKFEAKIEDRAITEDEKKKLLTEAEEALKKATTLEMAFTFIFSAAKKVLL